MMRPLLLTLCLALAACKNLAQTGITFAPHPAYPLDSAAQRAFAVAEHIARSHGMHSITGESQEVENWRQCFGLVTLFLCGKVYNGEIQFRMDQPHASHFGPRADSIRRELVDSLGSRFGRSRVRECRWLVNQTPPGSGCMPAAGGT